MTGIDRRMGAQDWTILLILALLWGGAFIFIEIGLRGLPPMTLVLARLALGTAVLWGWLRLRGRRVPGGIALWRAYAVLGVLNLALPFILITWAMTHISAGLTSILNATTPLWGVLVAHVFTDDEKATPARLAGVAFGIAGVTVMIGSDALRGLGDNLLAQIACLAGTLSYAIAVVYGRRFSALGVGAGEVATGQLAAATAMMLPIAIVVDRPWALPMPGMDVLISLLCLAVLSSAVAYLLYFRLLASAGVTNSLLVTFLIPVVTIFLAGLMLDERMEPRHWAGIALIAMGLVAIDGRLIPGRRSRTAPPG
jgi:drug/metabolite transporter (DMT)-like permease